MAEINRKQKATSRRSNSKLFEMTVLYIFAVYIVGKIVAKYSAIGNWFNKLC